MNGSYEKGLMINHSALISRVAGAGCGMAAGFACGVQTNDEFLTVALGIMGAFAGLGLGFVRALVAGLAVVLGVNLLMF